MIAVQSVDMATKANDTYAGRKEQKIEKIKFLLRKQLYLKYIVLRDEINN